MGDALLVGLASKPPEVFVALGRTRCGPKAGRAPAAAWPRPDQINCSRDSPHRFSGSPSHRCAAEVPGLRPHLAGTSAHACGADCTAPARGQIALTNRVAITAEVLDAVSTLKLIAVSATDYEHVDVAACTERGVTVCNVRDWFISVPEHVFALALALRRQVPSYRRAVAERQWQTSATYGFLLPPMPITRAGSTLGIVGHGSLGHRVEAIARGFGMKVLIAEHKGAVSIRAGRTVFADVLAHSQVLVILCPLNEQTRDLIGATELALMPPEALLINCARRHRE